MIENGKIRIYQKTQSQWLIWGIFIIPFFYALLTEWLGLPSMIRYVMDGFWLLLLVLLFLNRRKRGAVQAFSWWVGGFILYAVLFYAVQFQSPLYLLWGIRNNFRFYVLFLGVVCFLKQEDRNVYMKWIDLLFWGNAVATAFQFLVLGYYGDFLGGIFGVQEGANGYTNLFLVIYLAKTAAWYLDKRVSSGYSFFVMAVCLLIAAVAELKFYFIEAVAIIVLASLIGRLSWKKLLLLVSVAVACWVGITLLLLVFPNSGYFLRLSELFEAAVTDKGYTSAGDLNRLNAVGRISRELMDSTWDRIFGLGLGNCDTSDYAFLQTPFNTQYNYLHYTWLSTAFVFVEMGWVGLFFFFGFFALVYWKANRLRSAGGENEVYCQMSMIVAAMCVLIAIYNSSLRTEAGYMAYFVMALPFSGHK